MAEGSSREDERNLPEEITYLTVEKLGIYKRSILEQRKQWLEREREQDRKEILSIRNKKYRMRHSPCQ